MAERVREERRQCVGEVIAAAVLPACAMWAALCVARDSLYSYEIMIIGHAAGQ
jgi:hypothetical protein